MHFVLYQALIDVEGLAPYIVVEAFLCFACAFLSAFNVDDLHIFVPNIVVGVQRAMALGATYHYLALLHHVY